MDNTSMDYTAMEDSAMEDTALDDTAMSTSGHDPPGVLGDAPMLLVSRRYGGALRRVVNATGRAMMAARLDDAARRFEASSVLLALVDARGAIEEGVVVLRTLAEPAKRRGAALVALVGRADAAALGRVHDAGATHVLASGGGIAALVAVLRSAERYGRRLSARGDAAAVAAAQVALTGGARWEWRRGAAHVELASPLAAMLGEQAEALQLSVKQALDRIDLSDREDFTRALMRLAHSATSGELSHRLTIAGVERTIAHHVRAHRDAHGRLTRLTGIVEDLDAVLAERRLSAHYDVLTGLANAAYARDWIDELVGGGSDYDPACIVLMLSLTRFDGINAAYGRAVADGLLQAVARRLRRIVGADRSEARVLARIAGAEFVVAFGGPVRLQEVTLAARRLGEAFENPFLVEGRVIHLATRMGVAVSENDGAGSETLLRRASAALARAKVGEPGSYEISDAAGEEDLFARAASLGDDLRAGIAADAFELLYQPQVDCVTNCIVGVEALVRWRHPTLGLLSAETLMEVAERAEVGRRLGEHILRKALAEATAWPAPLRRLRLAVNATADDLMAPDFVDRVLGAVHEAGFAPARLTIEATESGLMRDVTQAARALAGLRAHGVRVAIDDFGTGYSSLAYLSALPADYIKIDRSLIVDLVGSERDRVVVRGIVDIARRLELAVVAEGVETDEQRIGVVAVGCQAYQGFLCSRPVDGRALAGLVEAWNAAASVTEAEAEFADW